MGVCADEDMNVGVTVERLNTGGATDCVTCGEEKLEGVEAWSVANRSGVGVAAAGRMHPMVRMKVSNVNSNLVLFIFRFNGFKITFLAGQNFGAKASTKRT